MGVFGFNFGRPMNEDRCRIEVINPLGYINISAEGCYKTLHSDIKIVVSRRQKKYDYHSFQTIKQNNHKLENLLNYVPKVPGSILNAYTRCQWFID